MEEEKKSIPENYFFNSFGRKSPQRMFSFKFKLSKKFWFFLVIIVVFCFSTYLFFISPPSNFPANKVISIKSGLSLRAIAETLERESIIRSPFAFKVFVRIFENSKGAKAGDYVFENPQSVIRVAERITEGERGYAPIKIVIPEGTSVQEIADLFEEVMPDFNSREFIRIALPYEGYLFPDSYSFDFDATPQVVLDTFLKNFDKKIETLGREIDNFDWPLSDIIKMASIVEEEGRTFETRRIVAGILWNRMDIKMPLQADAVFKYENGKTTFELTMEDLQKDSPYNTYTRIGLPPTPITNPGLDSIKATINPKSSDYLYYLTGKDGKMYYAKTHDGHLVNKERYLR